MAKEIPSELRERIIASYHSGKGFTELGELFGCHRTTAKRIINAYLREGRSVPKKRGTVGRPKVLSELHVMTIRSHINANCTISLRELQEKLEEEFGLIIHTSTIDRAIDSFNYTLKRMSPIPVKRNDPVNIEKRFLYASSFLPLVSEQDGENIFFLDEVGFNVSMGRKRGRSLSGERATMTVPTIGSRNISVCCSMSKRGTFFIGSRTGLLIPKAFVSLLPIFWQR